MSTEGARKLTSTRTREVCECAASVRVQPYSAKQYNAFGFIYTPVCYRINKLLILFVCLIYSILATSGLGCKPPGASPLSTPLCSIIFFTLPAHTSLIRDITSIVHELSMVSLATLAICARGLYGFRNSYATFLVKGQRAVFL